MPSQHIQVAIGLIQLHGKILVGWRDAALAQGDCYEFPGGKIELSESPEQAVRREIMEETGLEIEISRKFGQVEFNYSDRQLKLYFYRCRIINLSKAYHPWHWVSLQTLRQLSFPAANQSILVRLDWPKQIKFTDACTDTIQNNTGVCFQGSIQALQRFLQQIDQTNKVIVEVENLKLLSQTLQQRVFAVLLSQPQRLDIGQLQDLDGYNLIAACQNYADLEHAQKLGCEAILLTDQQLSYLATDFPLIQNMVIYHSEILTLGQPLGAYQLIFK